MQLNLQDYPYYGLPDIGALVAFTQSEHKSVHVSGTICVIT